MNCKRIKELLSAYLDEALELAEKESVEKHLLSCTNCRSEKEKLEKAVSMVRSLKEVEPPTNFLRSVRSRLEQESVLRRWVRKALFPLPVKIPLEALAAMLIAATIIYISRPYHSSRQPMELARQERLTRPEEKKDIMDRIETIEEGRLRPAQLYELAKEAPEPKLEEEETFGLKARVAEVKEKSLKLKMTEAEEDLLQAPAEVATEPLAQRALARGRLVRDKMSQEEARISVSQAGIPAPITDNYQVQVATDNVPIGLVKAQRIIYQNRGNMIRPTDEFLVTQIASKDIKSAEIMFELPSYNYDQTLTQLKEIGKIIFIILPEGTEVRKDLKKEKEYKLDYSVHKKKPALINVLLELTQSESE